MATSFRVAFQEADDAPRTLAQAFKRANVLSNGNPTKTELVIGPQLGKLKDMRVISTPKGADKEHVLHMQRTTGFVG